MLMTYVGLPGSGKSLFDSYVAYTELTRIMNNHTKPHYLKDMWREFSFYDYVVKNTDFDDGRGNWVKWDYTNKVWDYGGYCLGATDFEELYNPLKMTEKMKQIFPDGVAKNCLCLFDESGTQFANTDWDKMPDDYRYFLTQHRKHISHLPKRFDIYVYTQHKDLIEITLRRISDRIYLIRPLFGFSRNPTRPSKLSLVSGIRLYLYWRHEVLESKPAPQIDSNGVLIPVSPKDMVESIEFITWYYFGKKYKRAYNTMHMMRKMVRESKKK